jgi:hypothetical protein
MPEREPYVPPRIREMSLDVVFDWLKLIKDCGEFLHAEGYRNYPIQGRIDAVVGRE